MTKDTNLKRQKRSVLIVDNDVELVHALASALHYEDVQVVSATSVEVAVKTLLGCHFTEIITDDFEGDWVKIVKVAGPIPITVWTIHPERYRPIPNTRVVDKASCDFAELIAGFGDQDIAHESDTTV